MQKVINYAVEIRPISYCTPEYTHQGHEAVLRRVDVLVIGPVAPHVRRRVDQPRGVQRDGVAQHLHHVRRPQRLAPKVPGDQRGDDDADGEAELPVVAVLEHDHGVGAEVVHVDLVALS